MGDLNTPFWIGLALAVPLSIVGNILTPKFQALMARYSHSAAQKRLARNEQMEAKISVYVQHPQRLVLFLVSSIIVVIWLAVMSGLFAALMYFMGLYGESSLLRGAALFFLIVGGVIVAKICADAMSVISKVKASDGG